MYIFFSDPGHGWLRVPLSEVEPIKYKISKYSYKDREYAYLEEDCDAWRFLTYKFGKDINFQELQSNGIVIEKHIENIFIRDLPYYR